MLTFIIPVRHPENATDWSELKRRLSETAHSIAKQDDASWRAVVVANRGADIPPLPRGFDVEWVDFSPNPLHERGAAADELVYDAVRMDKGSRILAGLFHYALSGHVMVVDDDDFVSRRLAGFVNSNAQDNGWFFQDGFVWSHGRFLYKHPDFFNLCGTSHIIRADLFDLPERSELATQTYIKAMLGSHIYIKKALEASGTPLKPLPFIGAVYRTGHPGSHSKSQDIFNRYLKDPSVRRKPRELWSRLRRFRIINDSIKSEYFGGP